MQRKEKEITELSEIEAILERAEILHLAMCDGERPYVLPLNFGYRTGRLYLHSARAGKKIAILRANPLVSFAASVDVARLVPSDTSDACKYGMRFKSVVGAGRATISETLEEIAAGLDVLMSRYGDHNFEYKEEILNKTALITIEIESMTGKLGDVV